MREARILRRRLLAIEEARRTIVEAWAPTCEGGIGALFSDRVAVDVRTCCTFEEEDQPEVPVFMGAVQMYQALGALATDLTCLLNTIEKSDLEMNRSGYELVEVHS